MATVLLALFCGVYAPAVAAQDLSNDRHRDQAPVESDAGNRGRAGRGEPLWTVGPVELRIGGFLGLTGLYRSTNSGGGPGTAFASIPYADSVQGNVSEARLSAESSRLSIRVDAAFPEEGERFRRLSGYFEMDFNGNAPGNVAVTSSSSTLRLRHAFAEVQYRDTFFMSVGQAFTLMTAVKDQLSTWPSDVELTQAVDTNYLAGMLWARLPQFRLTWRPSPAIQLGRRRSRIPNSRSGTG